MPSSGGQTCARSEEHTSELQSQSHLVCRLLLEKKEEDLKSAFEDPTAHHDFGRVRVARPALRCPGPAPPSRPRLACAQAPRTPFFFFKGGGAPGDPPLSPRARGSA